MMEVGSSSFRDVLPAAQRHSGTRGILHELLDQLCAEPPSGSAFLLAAVPVATVEPTRLLQALPHEPAVFWSPAPHEAVCGVGAAARIEATGPDRFAEVRRSLDALWASMEASPLAADAIPWPRALGGFSFQPGSANTDGWKELGDAVFLLPRWTYLQSNETSWLLAVRDRRRGEADLRRLASELDHIIDTLERDEPPGAETGGPALQGAAHPGPMDSEPTPEDWEQQVASILDAIHQGAVEKVVTARSVTVALARESSPSALLDALQIHDAASTRFAIRCARTAFLGATPERLVRKEGDEVSTEALAGTRDRGNDEALLASGKDLREHAFVVSAIQAALEPFCHRLDVTSQPELHTLPHLVHLKSPVRGELRPETHVLDLVEALHPTPAVGGVPRAAALAWIDDHETTARGWYAAPFGWVDRDGNGDFCVAIRCALVNSDTAQLFAGAGIVEGSESGQEFAETEWKLRTLRSAVTRLQTKPV